MTTVLGADVARCHGWRNLATGEHKPPCVDCLRRTPPRVSDWQEVADFAPVLHRGEWHCTARIEPR